MEVLFTTILKDGQKQFIPFNETQVVDIEIGDTLVLQKRNPLYRHIERAIVDIYQTLPERLQSIAFMDHPIHHGFFVIIDHKKPMYTLTPQQTKDGTEVNVVNYVKPVDDTIYTANLFVPNSFEFDGSIHLKNLLLDAFEHITWFSLDWRNALTPTSSQSLIQQVITITNDGVKLPENKENIQS